MAAFGFWIENFCGKCAHLITVVLRRRPKRRAEKLQPSDELSILSLAVTPDLSSGGMVRRLLRAEGRINTKVFSCFEDFTVGPLLDGLSPEELLRIRHRYWCRKIGMNLVGLYPTEHRKKERYSLRVLVSRADKIEVFLGGSGNEQLFLLGFAELVRTSNIDVSKVQILQYPAAEPWHSLGMLNLDKLAERPKPISMTSDLLRQLTGAWSKVCSRTPHALIELRASSSAFGNFPYMDRAVEDLVYAYPDEKSGLTLADERLLTNLPREWTKSMRVVGSALVGSGTGGRSFSDGVLLSRLRELAEMKHAPIELRGDRNEMRETDARITEYGLACLKGEQNLTLLNGIDKWVGGVHLSSAIGSAWFRDDQGLVGTDAKFD